MNLWIHELAQTVEQLDTRAKLLEALDIIEDQYQVLDESEQETAARLAAVLNQRLDALRE
jgi:NADH:ubiquinone oxidoreductase subunit E